MDKFIMSQDWKKVIPLRNIESMFITADVMEDGRDVYFIYVWAPVRNELRKIEFARYPILQDAQHALINVMNQLDSSIMGSFSIQ